MGEQESGFCLACGIYVQRDASDCKCTAMRNHTAECPYTKSVSCPISVGIYCKHNLEACEACDCVCGFYVKETGK